MLYINNKGKYYATNGILCLSGKICFFTFHMFVFLLMTFFYSWKYEYLFFSLHMLCKFYLKNYIFSWYFCFNYLQDVFYLKLRLLVPVPSFSLQEQNPSISFSFNLIFNLFFIMGFFLRRLDTSCLAQI